MLANEEDEDERVAMSWERLLPVDSRLIAGPTHLPGVEYICT